MSELTIKEKQTITETIAFAQKHIRVKTGRLVRLTMVTERKDIRPEVAPEIVLQLIADTLNVRMSDVTDRGRNRMIVMARSVASLILREAFPSLSYAQIGQMYGGQHHTTVLHGLRIGLNRLDCEEEEFTNKYHAARQAVDKLMQYEKYD